LSEIRRFLSMGPVMPVVVIDRVEQALPLARAILAGGIRVIEVTLRTPAALEAVRAICKGLPEMAVGVGTIVRTADIAAAREAGAAFGVSPGASPALLEAAARDPLPFLPGVMTPSDIVCALAAGFDAVKLFPARLAGGVPMLSAMAGPFPSLWFCPTGGIDAGSAHDYLALPNVACVGGTWIAPAKLIEAADWAGIQAHAHGAAALRPARPSTGRSS
jgi:2-dehydro-3-deoxyphosphogluconate aldolase / (4S)-4-hydroxy-2-oxoglutarate aldolase